MIVLLIMMASISAILRLIPFLFAKTLTKWRALEKLAASLPLCISILLVAHLLHQDPTGPFALPELVGLAAVVGMQLWQRNLLISMGAGVFVHQMMLYVL